MQNVEQLQSNPDETVAREAWDLTVKINSIQRKLLFQVKNRFSYSRYLSPAPSCSLAPSIFLSFFYPLLSFLCLTTFLIVEFLSFPPAVTLMEVCIYVKLGAFGAFTLPVHPSPVLNTSHVRLASRTGRTSKVVLLKDWSALGDTFSDAQEAAASVIHGGGGGDGSCESPVSSALREVGVTCSVSRTISFVSRRRPLYVRHMGKSISPHFYINLHPS